MSHWEVQIGIKAERVRPAIFSFAYDGDAPYTDMAAFAQKMAEKVSPCIGGRVASITYTRDIPLPPGLKTAETADASATVGRKMVLPLALADDPQVVKSINAIATQVMIPTWRRNQIDPNPYYWSSRRKRKVYGPAFSPEWVAFSQMLIAPHEVNPAFVPWTDCYGMGRVSNIVSPRIRRF